MKIESERLVIETIQSHTDVTNCELTELVTTKSTEYLPPSWSQMVARGEQNRWLDERLAESTVLKISLRGEQKVIGLMFLFGLSLTSVNNEVRLGYIVSEAYWGKGYASEILAALIHHLKGLGSVKTLTGGVAPENIGSVKVMTNNGFELLSQEGSSAFYQYRF